jgi:hypothetical protein
MDTPAPLPTAELADLGEKLQQAIVLTRIRITPLPTSRVKARATRVLEHADRLFRHMTLMVQASNSLTSFLTKAVGVTIDDMFAYTGRPKIARGVAYAGISAANDAVRNVLIELAAINAAIDKEVKNAK